MNELSKDAVSWLTIGDDAAGQRIDNFLTRKLKGVPKSHIYRILRSGEVRLNKGRIGPDTRLSPGDVVRIPPLRLGTTNRAEHAGSAGRMPGAMASMPRPFAVPILYEDDALIALDKPAGLAVHGGSGIALGLIEALRASRPGVAMLELVHRLDRDTSGVLLVAKKRAALTALHAQLRGGSVDKRYLVLVRGPWRDALRRVELPLHKFATREGERRVRVEESGRASATTLRRERVWPQSTPPLALLEAELETGRTHQIRVHCAHLGYPVAGDSKYGDFGWNKALARQGLKRMFLHAARLGFTHPVSGAAMSVASPLPGDLDAFLASLDR
jgi:23S rRNA pseudouridine955/2504/2580 synthase